VLFQQNLDHKQICPKYGSSKNEILRPLLGLTIPDCQRKSNTHNRLTTDNTVEDLKAHKKNSFDHHMKWNDKDYQDWLSSTSPRNNET